MSELIDLFHCCMKRILHPTSGRFLEVYSNHPGLHIYTGNELPDPEYSNFRDLQIGTFESVNVKLKLTCV